MKGAGAAERLFDLMNQQSPIKMNCTYIGCGRDTIEKIGC